MLRLNYDISHTHIPVNNNHNAKHISEVLSSGNGKPSIIITRGGHP